MISDPGSKLISIAIREGVPVIPIPGPSAAIASLIGSGLDPSQFFFVGFLPDKQSTSRTFPIHDRCVCAGNRYRRLESLEDIAATLILFVAPSDLITVLRSCIDVFGEARRCCIAKEITKIHEVRISRDLTS